MRGRLALKRGTQMGSASPGRSRSWDASPEGDGPRQELEAEASGEGVAHMGGGLVVWEGIWRGHRLRERCGGWCDVSIVTWRGPCLGLQPPGRETEDQRARVFSGERPWCGSNGERGS